MFLENHVKRGNLFDNVKVVGGQVTDPAKVLDGLLALVLGHEPAGAFPDPESSKEKHTSGDELDGEGNDPLSMVGRESLLNAIVDPETDQTSSLPAEFVDTDKATSDGGRRDLGDVDGCDHGTGSDTNTSKNATTENQTKTTVTVCAEHHSSTEDEDEGEDHERLLTTKEVGRDICEEAAEESSSLVKRDNVLLRVAELRSAHLLEAEFIDEAGKGQSRSNESTASLY